MILRSSTPASAGTPPGQPPAEPVLPAEPPPVEDKNISWSTYVQDPATRQYTNLHSIFYALLQKYEGHIKLVAEDMKLPEKKVRGHLREFRRALLNPRSTLWGYPNNRNIPTPSKCWYCVKFEKATCTATQANNEILKAVTCDNVPVCTACKEVCVDERGERTVCKTFCKDCGLQGHASKQSKQCKLEVKRYCSTCGLQNCNALWCAKPRSKTTDERAKKVLQLTNQAIPETSAELQNLAQIMVDMSMAKDAQAVSEQDSKTQATLDTIATQIVAYDKMAEFTTWCCKNGEGGPTLPSTGNSKILRNAQQQYYNELYRYEREEYRSDPSITNRYSRFMHDIKNSKGVEVQQHQQILRNGTAHERQLQARCQLMRTAKKGLRKYRKQKDFSRSKKLTDEEFEQYLLGRRELWLDIASAKSVLDTLQIDQEGSEEDVRRQAVEALEQFDTNFTDLQKKLACAQMTLQQLKSYRTERDTALPLLQKHTIHMGIEKPQVKKQKEKQKASAVVGAWNGRPDAVARPKDETAEQRQQAEQEKYRRSRLEYEIDAVNDSYNPKRCLNFQSRYSENAVNVEKPYFYVSQGPITAAQGLHAKKVIDKDLSFETIRARRCRRRAAEKFRLSGMIVQQKTLDPATETPQVDFGFITVTPKFLAKTQEKYMKQFQKDQEQMSSVLI